MVQGVSINNVVLKDAQIELRKEDYAKDMEHTAAPVIHPLLLHHVLGKNFRTTAKHPNQHSAASMQQVIAESYVEV